ncbi:MAG: agmatine deiminase family protein [Candidatus Sumerlaeia bacterium]
MARRFPAEWEPQDGVLLAWPHDARIWGEAGLASVQAFYVELVGAVARYETAVVAAPDPEAVGTRLDAAGVPLDSVILVAAATNDCWTRDFGPITVLDDGAPHLLDFTFTGWGGKFPAELDDALTVRLREAGVFAPEAGYRRSTLELEGGAIETDGEGVLLTTVRCLCNPNRNGGGLAREEMERRLRFLLGLKKVHWLFYGELMGDDTDGHVDQLARFAPGHTILYAAHPDPADAHARQLLRMETELRLLRTPEGVPYNLVPLALPAARFDERGRRLPCSYCNFLVINGAVLVPVFDDPNDAAALEAIGAAFPGREVIPLNALPIIREGGAIHCATMQLPRGVLNIKNRSTLTDSRSTVHARRN